MKRRIKRVGGRLQGKLCVLILVFVMGSAGVGISFSCGGSPPSPTCIYKVGIGYLRNGDLGPDPNYPPGQNNEGKDVASTAGYNDSCEYCGMSYGGHWVSFYKHFHLTVNNAYPWYKSNVTFWFGNCGTASIKLSSGSIDFVSGCSELLKFFVVDGWKLKYGSNTYTGSTWDSLVCKMKSITFCKKTVMTIILSFHFKEEYKDCHGHAHLMPQGSSVTFKIKTNWKQAC